ncbi:bifunctional NUDIX hydrolase/histidine phosphatase family protein [Corynebacterium sp.]|uniref:NUDIX hydrolase n=1 Tax=Corynebacterium sp. TaxID=1720 RepID=UPI0026DCB304|nr:bifunctional NUDIX hydrolase/histidine phosphatase family protein [Corynebacterium sp.]MDO4610046.1 bifunctional NUDIX hydrolase/histidine phosphatase family protein [Corynebacterium sp.]
MAMHENDKDTVNDTSLTGRHRTIGSKPGRDFTKPTFAAGAVLWRGGADDREVAVIHRPSYDDWSLAKGKLDPGENLPATAAREIEEETGYSVRLGKLLGHVDYPVTGRTKVVWYWTAEVLDGEFTPNDEVDELRWVSIDEAAELLSYDLDVEVLEKARKRLSAEPDTRIIYVRHARAHSRKNWSGDDDLRPLDKKGRRQAELLVSQIAPFRPDRIYAAEPDRCSQTVAPLAADLGLETVVDDLFGDRAWLGAMVEAQDRFMDVVAERGVSVICAQGLIIPDMIAWLSARGTLPLEEIDSKKGSMWVLGFEDGVLTTADYYASALPVK